MYSKIRPSLPIRCLAYTLWVLSACSHNAFAQPNCQPNPQPIVDFYHQHEQALRTLSPQKRLEFISGQLLGTPYGMFPLGGGCKDPYNPKPPYRLDTMDCVTYIDTVLALSFANHAHDFQQIMQRIRYLKPPYLFFNETHFPNSDWNQHLHKLGYITDITQAIHDAHGHSVARLSKTVIDKKQWLAKRLVTMTLTPLQRRYAIRQIQHIGKTTSNLYYLPLSSLLNHEDLLQQIPSGTIIAIVRPNWDLRKKIGSKLDISHVGIAIRTAKGLVLRHGHEDHAVMEVDLKSYLKQCLTVQGVAGINLQKINLDIPHQA